MANVIAIIWDFDNTLIDGYMETPILNDYHIDARAFWDEVDMLPEKYLKEQGIRVNPDTIYLNQMINYARDGRFKGLNNQKLREYGKRMKFYKGVPDIFQRTKDLIEKNEIYQEYDIKVEHYIVSTGLAEVIKGSEVYPYVANVWGCEFIDVDAGNGETIIGEVGYAIDHTTKTRALFEINKGVGKVDGVTVNTSIPEENRRVHFMNMTYVADGPSDIPAFSLVNSHGGATFAIYPPGNEAAMQQVEQMRMNGRVNMFAEADYSEGKTASMWLCNKIREFAERIRRAERAKIEKYTQHGDPKHLG